jgi:DNA-directed RNA polymerase subunit RPC12/RpoP
MMENPGPLIDRENVHHSAYVKGSPKMPWKRFLSGQSAGKKQNMSYLSDRIRIEFTCPNCSNKFHKLLSWVKTRDAVTCPGCGNRFVDEALVKEVEARAKSLETYFSDEQSLE